MQLLKISDAILILIITCIREINCGDTYENGPCLLRRGKYGICSRVSNCDSIKRETEKPGYNLNYLYKVHCGYNGNTFLVCCPDRPYKSETQNPISLRSSDVENKIVFEDQLISGTGPSRADIACERYSRNISEALIPQIANGHSTALGDFPHMAALIYDYDETPWRCGGTLISDRYVLTAAHCFTTLGPIKVILGTNNLIDSKFAREYEIEENIPHPNYKPKYFYYDIGVIHLKEQVDFTNVLRPACLNTDPNLPIPASLLTVTGFGRIGEGFNDRLSSVLLQANVTYIPLDECNSTYTNEKPDDKSLPNGLDSGQFCAQGTLTKDQLISDSCSGDSGGPLQIRNIKFGNTSVIFGVVSSGGLGCPSNLPGIYTNVYYYLDWIESIVWRKN